MNNLSDSTLFTLAEFVVFYDLRGAQSWFVNRIGFGMRSPLTSPDSYSVRDMRVPDQNTTARQAHPLGEGGYCAKTAAQC